MTAEFSNLSLDLAKYLDQARQEGFSNVVTIEKPEEKIFIAFNDAHTQAKIFEQKNGHITFPVEPSKVFASKQLI